MSWFTDARDAMTGKSWLWGPDTILGGPTPPQAPDPNQLAQQQAEWNRFDQRTPWGNTAWSQGGDGRWTQSVSDSPDVAEARRALRGTFQIPTNLTGPALRTGSPWVLPQPKQQSTQGYMPGSRGVNVPNLGQAATPSAMPGVQAVNPWQLPTLPGGDYGAQRDQVTTSVFQRGSDLVNQQADRDQRRLDQRLANQGLPMGGEAFNEQQQLQQQGVMDARNRLALDAVLAGGQEQSRLAGLDLSRYGAGLQGAQTGFGQDLAANQNLFGQGATVADMGFNQRFNAQNQNADLLQRMFGMNQSEASRGFDEQFRTGAAQFEMDRGAQNDYINNVLAGSGQMFNQNLAANQQNFGQNLASQQQLLNVLMARMGNYQGAPAAQVDVFGPAQLQQASLNNAYQAELARQQGILGGLGNLGSAAIMAGM